MQSVVGSGPPSNTWSAGPTRVLNPTSISIGAGICLFSDINISQGVVVTRLGCGHHTVVGSLVIALLQIGL